MKIEKVCNFYASTYHLSIILMELLKEKNSENVITFFENGIDDEVNCLKEKYNYKIDKKINFKKTESVINKKIKFKDIELIIIIGSNQYMTTVNNYIIEEIKRERIIEKKQNIVKDNKIIKIVNCFDFNSEYLSMEEILNQNDKILYTVGEKMID